MELDKIPWHGEKPEGEPGMQRKPWLYQLRSQIPAPSAGLARKCMEIPSVSFPVSSFPELQRQQQH